MSTTGNVVKQNDTHVLLGYEDGTRCVLTNTEFAKLAEIRSRPPEERSYNHDIPLLPKDFRKFSDHQKWLYSQVIGDAAAEELFGDGPWLQRVRTAKRKGPHHK